MDLGVPKSLAFKAYYQYGQEAVSEIRKDPYRLVAHLEPSHWMDIDRVGHQLGFTESSQERVAGAFRCALQSSTNEGHVFLPQLELFKRVSRYLAYTDECAYYDTIDLLLDLEDIHILEGEETDSNSVYLAKMFHAESSVAFSLCQTYISGSRLALQAPKPKDLAHVEASLGITLASAQQEAIASSLTHKIVIITGGPGTGKTTIIKGVLQLWSEKKGKVLLAAPTGRAAKRLSESTGKTAKTIHRLLEYRLDTGLFNRNAGNKIHADLMVVDESSMIDIQLMACLLEALPDYCHLLLVGDVDQLPAVGPGYVLHDLI
jgi:exodeoxyribonuclease V alpha subunit